MATNSNQWPKDRVVERKTMGGADEGVLSNLATKVSLLTKQLHKQTLGRYSISIGDNTIVWNVNQDR